MSVAPPPVNPFSPPQVESFPAFELRHDRRPQPRRGGSVFWGIGFVLCFLVAFLFFFIAIVDESAVRVAAYAGIACFWAIMARIMQAERLG